jgi:dipeptidyl aminopeptidase/acylaminoacyl peptidase
MLGQELNTAENGMEVRVKEQQVEWRSAGLKISGLVEFPEGANRGAPRAGVLVLHGFGSNKDSPMVRTVTRLFTSLGYVALRFDMRGCGQSEGERGRVLCLEQVDDTKSALDFLAASGYADPKRIAVFGHSFGAAVAVYAAGTDPRIGACISSGGWGNGEKKFRRQHASPEAWQRFSAMMEEGGRRRQRGERMMVPRFDIVPIRPGLRGNLAAGSILEFPFEVVESMYAFTANEVVGRIAPRPLLLLHPANDTVTPTEQSIDLFAHAGQPTDLHLFADVDHFLFSDDNPMVHTVLRDWLKRYFPA